MNQYKCNLYLLSCLTLLLPSNPLIIPPSRSPSIVPPVAAPSSAPDSPDAKKPPRKAVNLLSVSLLNFERPFKFPDALDRAAGTKFCRHHNLDCRLLVLGGGVNRDLARPDFIVIKHIISPLLSGHCSSPSPRLSVHDG